MILTGKTISPGLARGMTHVIDARGTLESALAIAPAGTPQAEVERSARGHWQACVELDFRVRQWTGRVGASDVVFSSRTRGFAPEIRQPRRTRDPRERAVGEAAVSRVTGDLRAAFLANPVPLVHDKAADILDIGRRLIHCLSASLHADVDLEQGTVIVAPSLTPSQLVRFAHHGIVAVVTETCGPKSHTAILARGLGIPLVTGIPSVCELIPQRIEAIVDSATGRVMFSLSAEEQSAFQQAFTQQSAEISDQSDVPPECPVTSDGVRIRVLLNISDAVEAGAVTLGSERRGVVRAVRLHGPGRWPTEDESIPATVPWPIGCRTMSSICDWSVRRRKMSGLAGPRVATPAWETRDSPVVTAGRHPTPSSTPVNLAHGSR